MGSFKSISSSNFCRMLDVSVIFIYIDYMQYICR